MILHISQGCFSYQKHAKHHLLHNIEFSVQNGDLLAVLGPNGAGKTTLLKCLMGLLRWSSGTSTLDNEDIRKIPVSRLWQTIAYVPQAKNTLISYPVQEMILLGRSSHLSFFQKPKSSDYLMVDKVMQQLHIEYLKDKKCNEISGGELQMVLIAKALMSDPKLLILDEPESNLDYKNQIIVLDAMSKLASNGMTCIFNTHYPAHALQRANKALLLKKDGTYLFGNVNEVINEENLAQSFGVNAVIGEIETPSRTLKDVVALSVKEDLELKSNTISSSSYLAIVSIIMSTNSYVDQMNQILHDYSSYFVGRMGMPYREHKIYLIHLTMDAPKKVTDELAQRLMMLPDLSVKVTFEQIN